MKREILFRGLRTDGKGFVYGDLQQNFDCFKIREKEVDCIAKSFVVELKSIGQFTGLTDKNGVEIYEGDYLVDRFPIDEEDLSKGYNEGLLPVVWCDKQLMWCVDVSFAKDGSYLTSLVEYFGEFLEVKGNIH